MGKKILVLFIICMLAVIFSMFVIADETGSITGKINPIDSNASVYLKQGGYPTESNNDVKVYAYTTINSNGEYTITAPPGKYDLMITAEGYYINTSITRLLRFFVHPL